MHSQKPIHVSIELNIYIYHKTNILTQETCKSFSIKHLKLNPCGGTTALVMLKQSCQSVQVTAAVETLDKSPNPSTPNNLELTDDSLDDNEPPRLGPQRVWCYDEPDM